MGHRQTGGEITKGVTVQRENKRVDHSARGHSNLKGLGAEKEPAEEARKKHQNRRKIKRMSCIKEEG